jgi:beta-lactam-binding protein with PASTA domain/tRNA A-37 threonylcarbamoyl transferase component Bud32
MTDRVGQVLSERYRLLAPIGTGASASVYLADDITLRRRVAVKILHDALAGDEAFLRRFRAEAQAAAALNHPHIMAVYDWGHDDVPFLVTEYLGGGSLRTMLDTGRLLTPAQALMVGLEAVRGLDYAHRSGFVHRDIKPANLLFDEEARLRIADFGLARALAEAAWTEPQGAVLGTARYASPEQARGENLDGRSDVYSLGLVIIEAVTGSVPFATDTTIGTLMARVDQAVAVPEALGPLRPALSAAGRPDPAERPDAAEFTKLLMAAASELDRPEPLVLAGSMVHDHDVMADRDPTVILRPDEPDEPDEPDGPRDGLVVDLTGDPAPVLFDHEAVLDGSSPEQATTRGRGRAVLLALLLVLALAGAGAYWYYEIRVPTFAVPTLVGTNVDTLEPTIGSHGWEIQRTDIYQDLTVAGQILGQDPAEGTQLARGGVLALTVSLGPPPVDVPTTIVGKPIAEATASLQAVGLKVGALTRQYDERVPADSVIALAPGVGAQAPKGSAVPLVVSDGPAPRTIPAGVVGATQDAATAKLRDLGLKVSVTTDSSETVPAGTVISVNPAQGGQAARDSTVTLVVSSGLPMVTVPDVSGHSVTDAANLLQAKGLNVSGTQGNPLGTVKSTNPAAGTSVHKGSAVLLIIG